MIETATLPVNYAAIEHPSDVEHRLRRLEAAVAALQDTQLMEERIAERIVQKSKRSPLTAVRDTAGVIVNAGKALMPTAAVPPADKPGWLLADLWSELRAFGKMLFDHRYPFSYAGRFGPIVVACAYAFSWMFLSGMPLIGGVTERLVDVALAFILYKIMAREVQRYRAMFPA